MKYRHWFEIIFAVLLYLLLISPTYPFPHTVYQCPGVSAFIVYYVKDGKVQSIVGASGTSYLACQGENCLHDQARQAELIIYNNAIIVDNARVVDLNQLCQ